MGVMVKMKRKKILGAVAVFLMLLVSFAPAISSVKTKEAANNGQPNIEVEIIDIEYVRYELIVEQAIYEITYEITFENADFWDYEINLLYANSDGGYTEKTILVEGPFEGSGTLTESKEIEIKSEIFKDNDEERFFLRDDVDLKVTAYPGGGMLASGDPIIASDTSFVKYWKESDDYKHTLSQLLGSLPSKQNEYKNTPDGTRLLIPSRLLYSGKSPGQWLDLLEDLWQIILDSDFDFINAEGEIDWNEIDLIWEAASNKIKNDFLPFIFTEVGQNLKNHRFGWMKDNIWHITNLTLDVLNLLENAAVFAGLAWEHLKPFVDMITHTVMFFAYTFQGLAGQATTEFTLAMASAQDILANNHMTKLIETVIDEGREVIALVGILSNDWDAFLDWRATEPWEEPIDIFVTVDFVKEGEVVTVEILDDTGVVKTETKTVETSSGTTDIKFQVVTDGLSDPKKSHLCMIKVKGSEHSGKVLETKHSALWHCYSGGQVFNRFHDEDWGARDRSISLFNQLISEFPIFAKIFYLFLS
jgi:hypothetical protein